MSLDPEKLKQDFPLLRNNPELSYLDNAATSQKPDSVIDRIEQFYKEENSNVGRGLYKLAGKSTRAYQSSRNEISNFVGAKNKEIVFVRGCTEGMNLLASALPREGRVAVPESAHHSEMLPWRKQFGEDAVDYIPTEKGRIDMEAAKNVIGKEHSIVSISHISNVFGTEAPVREAVKIAHENDAKVVLDAAQSVPHKPVNFKELNVDFATFSGHKMLGPTGIGCLYGKKEELEALEPVEVGGGMVRTVKKDEVRYKKPPEKFEAGTPNIAGAVGLAEASRYLSEIGMDKVPQHERQLCGIVREKLSQLEGVEIQSPGNSTVVSFTCDWAHPHDVAEILNQYEVAVRAGHHCAQPMMEELERKGTVRASPYIYNTEQDIEKMIEGVEEAMKVFR